MDYHSVHGKDVSNFDLPDTHRLPTVSAAAALDELDASGPKHLPTGLPDLDAALAGRDHAAGGGSSSSSKGRGGIQRGQVTEIWGPPGSGKTTLGMQVAAGALKSGFGVVWVDCFHPLYTPRLSSLVSRREPADEPSRPTAQGSLIHFDCPTLPHLMALLCRPRTSHVPQDTSVIVVDSLSALVNSTFPKTPETLRGSRGNAKGQLSTQSGRRLQTLQFIIGSLQKLAATRNAAVVVLSQCATRMQSERGATLTAAVNATVWEHGISTRVILYRDWTWGGQGATGARFAGVQKVNGRSLETVEKGIGFDITAHGLVSAHYDASQPPIAVAAPQRKRKLDTAGLEIPDSEDDEDYGWADEDDDGLPLVPSQQWQGSEDLMLGGHGRDNRGSEEEDDDDEDKPEADEGAEAGDGRGRSKSSTTPPLV